jgi:DnaJ-class molecular chaperone
MSRTKKDILTDPLLSKGHSHILKGHEPDVCPQCGGTGTLDDVYNENICPQCEGEGVIYG